MLQTRSDQSRPEMLLVALAALFIVGSYADEEFAEINFMPKEIVDLQVGEVRMVRFNWTRNSGFHFVLNISLEDHDLAFVAGRHSFNLSVIYFDSRVATKTVMRNVFYIQGSYLGKTNILYKVTNYDKQGGFRSVNIINSQRLHVIRPHHVLDLVFNYTWTAFVVLAYFLMAIETDWAALKRTIESPRAIAVGMFCSFLAIPAVTYGTTLFLPVSPVTALGIVMFGCLPGSLMSVPMTRFLDGDVDLAKTFMFFDVMAYIGMTVLLIFVVDRISMEFFYVHIHYNTPIVCAAFMLIILLTLLGVFLRYMLPAPMERLASTLRVPVIMLGAVCVILLVAANVYVVHAANGIMLLAVVFIKLVGQGIAALAAWPSTRNIKEFRTFVICAGTVNAEFALPILRLALVQPDADMASTICILILVFQPIVFATVGLVTLIRSKVKGKLFASTQAKKRQQPEDEQLDEQGGIELTQDELTQGEVRESSEL